MPSETLPVTVPGRPARNKGRIVGQKRPLAPKQVWSIRARLGMADSQRDLALFNTAIDSKLRGCDLVGLMAAAATCRSLTAAHDTAEPQRPSTR